MSSMVQKQRNEYLAKRREFEPESVTLVIVAESPRVSGSITSTIRMAR